MGWFTVPRRLVVAIVAGVVIAVTVSSAGVAAVTWTKAAAPLLKARRGAGGATVNGRVYVLGGWTPTGLTRAAEYLRLRDRTWHSIAPMPGAKSAFGTAVVGGRIYAVGGLGSDESGDWTALKTVYAYTPSTNTWRILKPLPQGLARTTATGVGDGKLYVFGGSRDAGFHHAASAAYAYTPTTNSWQALAPMPTARMDARSVTSAGRAWVLGGFSPTRGYLDTNEVYDPPTNEWSTATPMIKGRSSAAAEKAGDGHFYVIGGFNPAYGVGTTAVMDEVEAYDPATDVWSVEPRIPEARAHPSSAVQNGNIYVMGGSGVDGTVLASVDVLRPDVASTVTGSQNPRFRVRVSITPTHPTVGQTVIARFTITNTTRRTLHGGWQFTFSTPDWGIGAAVAGPLRPGVLAGETLRQKVTATTPNGRYVIYAEASNRRGSSHARAHATFVSPEG